VHACIRRAGGGEAVCIAPCDSHFLKQSLVDDSHTATTQFGSATHAAQQPSAFGVCIFLGNGGSSSVCMVTCTGSDRRCSK